jgi:hypothetical protein
MEMYIAGTVPKAFKQKAATEIPEIAAVFKPGIKTVKPIQPSKKAAKPPTLIELALPNLLARGQITAIPAAVGIAPTALIRPEIEVPPVKA